MMASSGLIYLYDLMGWMEKDLNVLKRKGQLQVWDEKFLLDEIIGIYILMQNKKLSFYIGSSLYIYTGRW